MFRDWVLTDVRTPHHHWSPTGPPTSAPTLLPPQPLRASPGWWWWGGANLGVISMPTTVRIAVFSTDPEAGLADNLDYVTSRESSRHERWSVYGGQDPVRIYWPLDGQLSLFLQLWQPQPAIADSVFIITFPDSPNALGWKCVVPAVGRVPLLLSKPAVTDIIEISADPYSIEAEAVYF